MKVQGTRDKGQGTRNETQNEDFPYGMKEFTVKDCNGYVLQFGQDMEA